MSRRGPHGARPHGQRPHRREAPRGDAPRQAIVRPEIRPGPGSRTDTSASQEVDLLLVSRSEPIASVPDPSIAGIGTPRSTDHGQPELTAHMSVAADREIDRPTTEALAAPGRPPLELAAQIRHDDREAVAEPPVAEPPVAEPPHADAEVPVAADAEVPVAPAHAEPAETPAHAERAESPAAAEPPAPAWRAVPRRARPDPGNQDAGDGQASAVARPRGRGETDRRRGPDRPDGADRNASDAANGDGSRPTERAGGCTPAQLRRFIKSRAWVPMHELRRRFAINGTEDDVAAIETQLGRVYVGLPPRESQMLGDLVRAGDVGYELSLDPVTPMVVGVFPMRPVSRN